MGWRDLFGSGKAQTTADLFAQAEAARPPATASTSRSVPAPTAPSPTSHDPLAQVAALAAAGDKIEAIKLYREHYGTSLVDAKEAVEAISRGDAKPPPPAQPSVASDAQVVALVEDGKLIDAIKAYREIHNVGLKEAKDAVDRMKA